MMQQIQVLFVITSTCLLTVIEYCSPASLVPQLNNNQKVQLAKAQTTSRPNNFAYAVQDHRLGVIVPLVPVYPVYVFDTPNQITQKKLQKLPQASLPIPFNELIQKKIDNLQIPTVPESTKKIFQYSTALQNDFTSIEPKSSINIDSDTKTISMETPINNSDCNFWPESLQFSSKAIRAVMVVAHDIRDVKEYSGTPTLEYYIRNITDYAKDASFHIILAVGSRGAPAALAIQTTKAAVDAALVASNIALRTADEYEKNTDFPNRQVVHKFAQRAVETSLVAKEIISNARLF